MRRSNGSSAICRWRPEMRSGASRPSARTAPARLGLVFSHQVRAARSSATSRPAWSPSTADLSRRLDFPGAGILRRWPTRAVMPNPSCSWPGLSDTSSRSRRRRPRDRGCIRVRAELRLPDAALSQLLKSTSPGESSGQLRIASRYERLSGSIGLASEPQRDLFGRRLPPAPGNPLTVLGRPEGALRSNEMKDVAANPALAPENAALAADERAARLKLLAQRLRDPDGLDRETLAQIEHLTANEP